MTPPYSPLYFKDPVAALWMLKHHGVRIVDLETNDGETYELSLEDFIEELDASLDNFWVHPESVHLMQVQEGDVIQVHSNNVHSIQEVLPGTKEPNQQYLDTFKGRIIQRRGIPFMWPQTEGEGV